MLEEGRLPTLIAGIATMLFAAWILWLGPSRRVHRALALFLGLRALIHLLVPFDQSVDSATGRIVAYLFIALPFAAINFGYVFLAEHVAPRNLLHPRVLPFVRVLILITALLFEGLYLVDHGRWVRATPDGSEEGWMTLFIPLFSTMMAGVALVVHLAARSMPRSPLATPLNLLAFAFLVEPAYRLTYETLNQMQVLDTALDLTKMVLLILGLTTAIWTLSGLVAQNLRRRQVLIVGGLALATGFAVYIVRDNVPDPITPIQYLSLLWLLDAIWLLAFVGIATFATIMHRLFDIDLKAKRVVSGGTLAGLVGLLILILGEALERLVPVTDGELAIGAAVAIALGLQPLQVAARRLGDNIFPGVDNTPDHKRRRVREIYLASLEHALVDDGITERERRLLDHLAHELGLDAAEAEALEAERFGTRSPGPLHNAPPGAPHARRGLSKAP